ncbi:uncharacterized protein CTHT_0026880 [Thermochaetoides thermophila DSM 1495]|uniref:Extracellular membrane protein CFEM domain-containing protein n=1 Tax=Chaetomium thermophilum (strain DSM 1495 / CBS 144.50 / IMI 039719) TaxID=759272 RepID=G0S6U2_CHATD|nr:hypothetical protein CTHT_0026880 [Thermochaetoides thermophila DSM 1495]EGS20850.1 hypothetical protein CTHT_0026880 [Thermochaetoides thermophila DSM 1495]
MDGNGRTLSLWWLWTLFMMATTSLAVSLKSAQEIDLTGLPFACRLAYIANIEGCTTSDFANENTCSQTCVRALLRVQATIQSVCNTVDVPEATVLGQVLKGNILGVLCTPRGALPTKPKETPPSVNDDHYSPSDFGNAEYSDADYRINHYDYIVVVDDDDDDDDDYDLRNSEFCRDLRLHDVDERV